MENKKISQLDPYSGSPDAFDVPGVADGQTLRTNLGAAIQQKALSERLLRPSDLKTVNGVPLTGQGDLALDVANPFKGRFPAGTTETENLPSGSGVPRVGDFAYVDTLDANNNPVLKIYDCLSDGVWHDSGRTADPANVNTFADGQQLGLVHINPDLDTGGLNNVPSAEAVKGLNTRLYGSDEEVVGEPISISSDIRGIFIAQENDTWLGTSVGVRRSKRISIPDGTAVLRFTVQTGYSRKALYTFTKKAMPESNLSFDQLVSDSYLCDDVASYTDILKDNYASGDEVELQVPSGAKYLYFVTKDSSGNQHPAPLTATPVSTLHTPGDVEALLGRQVPGVVDSLDSDSATAALSARQGKRLAELTLQLVEPVNLLDPDTVKDGYYVRKDNGRETTGLSTVRGCTGFFEIPSEGICCDNAIENSGSYGVAAVVYNEAKERVGQVSANSGYRVAIDPTGHDTWKYVRFNVRTGDTGVYRGTSAPAYTPWFAPYLKMKDGTVADGSVTLDKLAFTRTMVGKNKLDPASILTGKAVRHTDGHVVSASGYGATDFIPVSRLGLVANHTPTTPGSISMGYAVYADRDVSTFIRGVAANGPTAVYSYRDSDEGGYVRFTVNTAWSQLQVEEGAEATAYEPYQTTKVIDPSVLPGAESQDGQHYYYADGVEVILPPEILVTQGDSLQLFYRPMVKAVNPYAFDILAICSSGKFYPRYLQLDTAYKNNDGVLAYLSTGTRTLTVSASVSSSVKVAEASTRIRIIPLPSSPAEQVNILLVGASRIEGGDITKELRRRLVGTDGIDLTLTTLNNRTRFANPKGLGLTNVNFVGRQSNDGARQDGKSGRQISYLTNIPEPIYTFYFTPAGQVLNQGDIYGQGDLQFKVKGSDADNGDLECTLLSGSDSVAASGILTLVSGTGSDTISYNSVEATSSNDFYDPMNRRISFAYYSGLYCGGVDINIFILHLCDNDIFNQPDISTIINDVKTLMRAYHGDYPDGKFILYSSCLPDVNGGLGVSYSGNAKNAYWNISKQYWAYNKALNALAADPEVAPYAILATTFVEFDAENLYFSNSLPTSNRSAATERLGHNGLHFGAAGQKTIADSLFHAVCHALNQINNPAS